MTPKLRALLVAIGVVSVGGSVYVINRPGPGVSLADLNDAGMSRCPNRALTCRFRIKRAMRNRLLDAGMSVRPNQKYVTLSARTDVCGAEDGGDPELITRAMRGMFNGTDDDETVEMMPEAECRLRTFAQYGSTLGPRDLVVEAPPCKRRKATGVCTWADGGVAPRDNVYPAAWLTGAGCEAVECSIVLGDNPETDL
jgi:hypothetical protein